MLKCSRSIPCGALLLALVSRWPAAAEEATAVSSVIVSATKIPTPLDQIGGSVTLVTADELEARQSRTAADALNLAPGLNIVRTGGPGGLTSVFIRGADSDHTKVLIDGIEVNDPSQGGAFEFGQLVTSDLARIEILRGPQSSLYGADALGGVINIVSKSGQGAPHLIATLEAGSFASFNQSAGLSGGNDKVHYAFNLAHFRSAATPVTPLDLLVPGRARLDDFYDNRTLSTKLSWDPIARLGLDLIARYANGHLKSTSDDFSVFPSVPAAAQTDQTSHQLATRLQARLGLFDGRFESLFGAGYTRYRTRVQSPDVPFGPQPPSFDRGDRTRIDWQGTLKLSPGETLAVGADDTRERLINSPVSAARREDGVWAELQSSPIKGLTVAASLRYDHDDHFGDKATWRIAPAWHIAATGTLLRASYGTGFKAPSLSSLFVSFPDFGFFANPSLRPESSRGYEVGVEQPLPWSGLRLGTTYFHNAIHDLITTNATGDSYANIGRASARGVESFVSATPTKTTGLRADYTYTVARDDVLAQDLLRRPREKLTLTGAWRPTPRLRLTTSMLYVGSWIDGNRSFSIQRLNASPYFTVNIAADYDLGHGVTLFGRIDNLLDRRYQNPVGFQQPGLGAFAGVKLDLSARSLGR